MIGTRGVELGKDKEKAPWCGADVYQRMNGRILWQWMSLTRALIWAAMELMRSLWRALQKRCSARCGADAPARRANENRNTSTPLLFSTLSPTLSERLLQISPMQESFRYTHTHTHTHTRECVHTHSHTHSHQATHSYIHTHRHMHFYLHLNGTDGAFIVPWVFISNLSHIQIPHTHTQQWAAQSSTLICVSMCGYWGIRHQAGYWTCWSCFWGGCVHWMTFKRAGLLIDPVQKWP